MRAREWLHEVKDPKIADLQRNLRKAGALNIEGPYLGKPLRVDGIEGPNTRYNMGLPQFAGIVSQYKNPSVAQPSNTVVAGQPEIVPATSSSAADNAVIRKIQTGIDTPTSQVDAAQAAARPAMPHTATPADAYKPDVAATKAKPKYDGIDPIVRDRMGMPPATTAEIDAYIKANPPVVSNLVSGDGTPVQSGGAKEVERAARQAAKEYETKQGQNPNISQDTRDNAKDAQDKAMMSSNETGNNFDITFGDRLDSKTKTIVNGKYKTVAQWSQETLGTPLQLTDLTLDQVKAFQKYKNSVAQDSGAVGAYQFMPTTLFGSVKNGKLAPGLVQQLKIPMTAKFDQQLQQTLQDKFMAANDAILKKNGVEVNSANRYMAHYVGPSGAVAVYKDIATNPNMTVAQSLVKHGYRDPTERNPELAILTVGQFPNIMAKRMAGAHGYGRPTPQQFAALANGNRVA
jgi:hypothetical protein